MNRKLSWVKEAFSRDVQIMQHGQLIGGMRRHLFSQDVEAWLNDVHLRFDVEGFLTHSVTVYDSKASDSPVGHIAIRFGKQAELRLLSGQTYWWKRHNMLMREWDMIQESPSGLPEKEIVNYDVTRKFFEDAGDIVVGKEEKSPDIEIVILTGLLIRNYFQRHRRVAAAIS